MKENRMNKVASKGKMPPALANQSDDEAADYDGDGEPMSSTVLGVLCRESGSIVIQQPHNWAVVKNKYIWLNRRVKEFKGLKSGKKETRTGKLLWDTRVLFQKMTDLY